MKKTVLLIIGILFLNMNAIAQTEVAPSVGDGSEGSPNEIATWENLYWISQNSSEWGKHYKQTADIDLSAASPSINTWDSNQGWTPIGNSTTKFAGNYDGQDFTISGLYISRSLTDNVGLFGYVNGGTISNLGLTNVDITTRNKVGGLVGLNNNGTIQNSYSTGSVSGSTLVGGLVGYNASSTIQNSYSTGSVNGSDDRVGGLVGSNSGGTVTNSFWDSETSNQSSSDGGTGKTTAEMRTQTAFTDAGWDFTDETANGTNDHWDFNGSISGYPFLAWQNSMNNTIPALNTDQQSFAAAGASVQFTVGNAGAIELNMVKTESEPNIVGSLPGSVQNLSQRYWSATVTSGTVTGTYNITLDLTGVSGINDCSTLYVLKRDNSSSPWQDVVADLGATLNRNDCPNSITIQGLTGFSDFVIGGGNDNPLPVELASYTLENQDNAVKLNWKTAAEVDNQGFILERSTKPNQGFEQVASYQSSSNLKGQGTVSQETSYEYLDYGKFKHGETYYYRLSDVDIAGNRNVLETKAITRPDAYSLEQNYPNPFNPVTTITFSLQKPGKTVLEVYNILGQKVKTLLNDELKAGMHIQRWDARGYASGVYFYRLQSGSFTQIKKMMLVK